jgi:hypothetical protein
MNYQEWIDVWECTKCGYRTDDICVMSLFGPCPSCGETEGRNKTVGRWIKYIDLVPRRFLWPKRVVRWDLQMHRDYKEASSR